MHEDIARLTPMLRRYAHALLSGDAGLPEVADDLVHDTLMAALKADRAAAGSRVWLYQTLIRLARQRVHVSATALTGEQKAMTACEARPAGAFGRFQRPDPLGQALESLPTEAREVLLLVVLEHFTHVEAAEVLGIDVGQVIAHLSQAREQLDVSLQPHFADKPVRVASHLRLVK